VFWRKLLLKKYYRLGLDSGASGDMFLGAFVSFLMSFSVEKEIESLVQTLKIRFDDIAKTFGDEYLVCYSEVEKNSQKALNVTLKKIENSNRSHHVTLATFGKILDSLQLKDLISVSERKIADSIINILANAEAKAHKVSLAKVHFHEIGEEDSIFDIIASSILISQIYSLDQDIDFLYEKVEIGYGHVQTSHGLLEIPAPATKNIIEEHGLEIKHQFEGENLTPTGAAILAYLKPKKVGLHELEQLRTITKGIGVGSRNPFDRDNILTLELLSSL